MALSQDSLALSSCMQHHIDCMSQHQQHACKCEYAEELANLEYGQKNEMPSHLRLQMQHHDQMVTVPGEGSKTDRT